MIVVVKAAIQPVKNGVQARNASVGLLGQGSTDDLAVRSLRTAVLGWCRGLERAGVLQDALERRGISWEKGGADLDVVVRPDLPSRPVRAEESPVSE